MAVGWEPEIVAGAGRAGGPWRPAGIGELSVAAGWSSRARLGAGFPVAVGWELEIVAGAGRAGGPWRPAGIGELSVAAGWSSRAR
ncbi:hypothetical protein ACIQCF_06340, partial [Streptomyces sp. NPDC088353]|uniref:hypothetical protein n=1 Tax=Streptomyces sp. NPDC088353 TaxID=3365855 RepID=UPI00382C14C7